MKKIDLAAVPAHTGSNYPPPFDAPCNAQSSQRLGHHGGLTLFGVNLTILEPGAWSSQRHWHSHEDEFIWVIEGELVLVTDSGEEVLRAGDCAGFPANDRDGHHLQNRSGQDVTLLEIGSRVTGSVGYYSDIDMVAPAGGKPAAYTHRDGTPYDGIRRRGPEDR